MYDIIFELNKAITPNTDALFHFITQTCDDNITFLRSRCITRLTILPDREVEGVNWVILGSKEEINEENLKIRSRSTSNLIQVYFNCHLRTLSEAIEINKNLEYTHIFTLKFDKK